MERVNVHEILYAHDRVVLQAPATGQKPPVASAGWPALPPRASPRGAGPATLDDRDAYVYGAPYAWGAFSAVAAAAPQQQLPPAPPRHGALPPAPAPMRTTGTVLGRAPTTGSSADTLWFKHSGSASAGPPVRIATVFDETLFNSVRGPGGSLDR
jgi:hypothetical protein